MRCDREVFLAGSAPDAPCSPFEWFDANPVQAIGDWLRARIGLGNDVRELPPVGAPPRGADHTGARR